MLVNPLVSVIIPTYNVEKYIEECMNSVLSQTYTNFEILVCDDCSTDGTINVLKKYSKIEKIRICTNKKNLRQARTRNKCIDLARGDFILVQDADDISEPQRIEKLIENFEDKVDFVGSACYCFNEKDGKYEVWKGRREFPTKRDLLFGIPFVHASIMFRKECLKKVGGYRNSKHTQRGEDYDLILRLYAAGFRGKNIDDTLYGYRVNRETIIRRSFKSRIDECFIRFEGFKANGILLPTGWLYVLKPIPAYVYQKIKYINQLRK